MDFTRTKDEPPELDHSASGDEAAALASVAATPADELLRQGSPQSCSKRSARDIGRISVVCALLCLAVGLVFGQTVQHDFINFDDHLYVTDNLQVSRGLTLPGAAWALTQSHASNWHPLTWLSHMLDCQLYGFAAWGHHLTSVLLHGAASVLLFLVMLSLTGRLWPSTLVAALFAIHPLRVESVAWVAERKDVLSGLLFVLTLGAYVRYARRPFSLGRYLTVVLLFALGLMAKSMLVTLPGVLLLLDYWPLGRFHQAPATGEPENGQLSAIPSLGWTVVLEKLPLVFMALFAAAIALWTQQASIQPGERFPLTARIANALVSYVAYLGDFFYPAGLAPFYPHPGSVPLLQAAGALLLLATITIGALVWRRQCPYLFVGWFWYLGMLLPVTGLIQVGTQARADRYSYLPQIGLTIALVWGAASLCQHWPQRRRRWLAVPALLAIAALMGCAWRQTSYWRNSETIWTRALAVARENEIAHNSLGLALADRGQVDAAIEHYEKALQIAPNSYEAHNNLANVLAKQGKRNEAIEHYRTAVSVETNFVKGRINLAGVLVQQGKIDEAIAQYEQALQIQPAYAEAHSNLGALLAGRGNVDAAMPHYETALRIQPTNAEAHNNLGVALAGRGQVDEALAHYRAALEIEPKYAQAHNNLANALADQGKLDEAVAHYETALENRPDHADAHFNLGVALHRQAAKHQDTALHGDAAQHHDADRQAVWHWREAVRLNPTQVVFLYRLAWALATSPDESLRNGPKAVELADRAIELSGGQDPALFDVLAAACAETGQFPRAIQSAGQALRLAEAQNNRPLAQALRQRLNRYRAGTPYREPR